MSGVDPLATLLADFDHPVAPRAEFADALWSRLEGELRGARPGARRSAGRSWRAWLGPLTAPRRRLVLLVVVLLLLLAGAATATYLGTHSWIGSGPRGAQVTEDYRLSTVFVDRGSEGPVAPWALSPDGHQLVGLRLTFRSAQPADLVRVAGVDAVAPVVHRTHLAAFGDAGLWSAGGVDPATVGLPDDPWIPSAERVAFSPSGDLFLVLEARDWSWGVVGGYARDATLVVVRADGRRQKVVSLRELVRSGLMPTRRFPRLTVAVSAPGRVWLRADVGGNGNYYGQKRPPGPLLHMLFEIVDPNGDGDWSDRVVHRVVLPPSLARLWARGRDTHLLGMSSFVGDPADGGSVLDVVTGPRSRVRVFRLADRNRDGDVADPGEATVVLDRQSALAGEMRMAVRAVEVGGRIDRQIVFAGLTRPDRVSVLSPSGDLADVGRAFPGLVRGLAAGNDGSIYVATFNEQDAPRSVTRVYRLAPAGRADGTLAAPPEPAPHLLAPLSGGAVVSAVVQTPGGDRRGYWLAARSGALRKLGTTVGLVCPSSDGRLLAFTSDRAVPYEDFVYLARRDGRVIRKVSELHGGLHCGWAGRWLVLASPRFSSDGFVATLYRLDARGGPDAVLARDVDRYSVSPDGLHVAYVRRAVGADGPRETLELVDVSTLRRHRLAGPVSGLTYGIPYPGYTPPDAGFAWSADGSRLAYLSSGLARTPAWWGRMPDPAQRYAIWVQRTDGRPAMRVERDVPTPGLAWSPDGRTLLACPFQPYGGRCDQTNRTGAPRLELIGADTGAVRPVGPRFRTVEFAAWAPSGTQLAYATFDALWLRRPNGSVRKLADAPADGWPLGDWLGWSPDGRFIGLGTVGPTETSPNTIEVVDVRRGRVRTLLRAPGTSQITAAWVRGVR